MNSNFLKSYDLEFVLKSINIKTFIYSSIQDSQVDPFFVKFALYFV